MTDTLRNLLRDLNATAYAALHQASRDQNHTIVSGLTMLALMTDHLVDENAKERA